MPNSNRWLGGVESGVYATSRFRKDFAKGDFLPLCVFGAKVIEVGSYETPV
jgi:hypothetical protein